MENRKGKQVLYGGLVPVGGGEDIRKICSEVNRVEILCTYL
jgi:hypothetical protein